MEIDHDEAVDMIFDYVSDCRKLQLKFVRFKFRNRTLMNYVKNSLADQEFVVTAASPDYDSNGHLFYPLVVNILASYT